VLLTDIEGIEDNYGDRISKSPADGRDHRDFNSIQKLKGLPFSIFAETLENAKVTRLKFWM